LPGLARELPTYEVQTIFCQNGIIFVTRLLGKTSEKKIILKNVLEYFALGYNVSVQ
jgi:hypothetical protein